MFVEFIEQLNKEPFWLKLCLTDFALPPSPVCLLCSVLSTGTFAVVIACTLPSGLLGSLPCGMGGRQDGMHPCMWLRVNLLIHFGLYMKIY